MTTDRMKRAWKTRRQKYGRLGSRDNGPRSTATVSIAPTWMPCLGDGCHYAVLAPETHCPKHLADLAREIPNG